MFIIFRVVATIICLLSIHILLNTKYKGREVAYLLLIIVVFFIHNIYIFPIYFKDFPTLKIIDDAAPFTVFYGPLLLGYYYVLNEGKIETRKIIIHISPIIFLFTTYYIFITNTDVREAFSPFYFHFVYFVLGLSMILKSKISSELILGFMGRKGCISCWYACGTYILSCCYMKTSFKAGEGLNQKNNGSAYQH